MPELKSRVTPTLVPFFFLLLSALSLRFFMIRDKWIPLNECVKIDEIVSKKRVEDKKKNTIIYSCSGCRYPSMSEKKKQWWKPQKEKWFISRHFVHRIDQEYHIFIFAVVVLDLRDNLWRKIRTFVRKNRFHDILVHPKKIQIIFSK